jgi:Tfp pilus assembly protein PilN
MVNSSILQNRMEELKREIEYLDKRIILMQDEVAEIDRALANRSVTSIRNVIQEREQRDDRKEKQTATR